MSQMCIDKEVSELGCNAISWGLTVCYIIFGIAVLAMIVLPLINTIKNPANLVKSGIGLGVLLVVFAVSYALADSTVSPIAKALDEDATSVRWIGAGLIMFYITLFASILGLIYSEINKALK